MRDSSYSIEIMKAQLKNKYISPEILYAFKNSIEALEKQIAQLTEKSIYDIMFCSKCKGSVWQVKSESNYCFRCGQKLKH